LASTLLYPESEQPRLALSEEGESIMNIRLQDTVGKSETSAITATRPNVMRRARQMVRRLWRDQRGATIIEYGAVAVLIGGICIGVVTEVGKSIQAAFTDLKTKVTTIQAK
jgi:Flp pilus assembly pilin Flp